MIFHNITVFESNLYLKFSLISMGPFILCFIFQSVVILTEFIEKIKQVSHWMTVSI